MQNMPEQAKQLTEGFFQNMFSQAGDGIFLIDEQGAMIEMNPRGCKGMLSVMILDLDNFKEANDTHGHVYGDQLLKIFTERLGNCLRKSDTAARMGGDEFALINEEVNDLESAKRIAIKVLDAISRTMEIEGRTIQVTARIGSRVYASDEDATSLVCQADIAMYQAKRARNCYQFYNPL